MDKLMQMINGLEQKIDAYQTKNPAVSNGSVGWHLAHCLMVINQVIPAMENSQPKNYKPKITFSKLLVFTLNKIPKGRVKAPKRVQLADELISSDQLKKNMEEAKLNLIKLNLMNKDQFFDHPYFGNLNLPSTKKFLKIHTNHHLKIINEITGKS